ncbi:MAG: MerR family transcriptional regulator [Candidatus Omnitrophota bacterium]
MKRVTQKIGISAERLRYWEKLGIVKPEYVQCGVRRFRRYSAEDIHRAVVVKALVDTKKYTIEGAIRKLGEGEIYLEFDYE